MIIGFTGTQKGLTDDQFRSIERWFCLNQTPLTEFHHGCCVGADVEVAAIAKEYGLKIISHPGHPKAKPHSTWQRGPDIDCDIILPAYPYLERNQHIVDASDFIMATPGQMNEVIRSGTWSTIRYALKQGKPVHLFMPDGTEQIREI